MTDRPTDKCDKWDFSNPPLTGQCQPTEAQAALDAVRAEIKRRIDYWQHREAAEDFRNRAPFWIVAGLAEALDVIERPENLDTRLKALEGK